MAQTEIRLVVERFGQRIRSIVSPRMIVLFGSHARNAASPASDIDIAIVVDRVVGDYLDTRIALYKARREIDIRIEPLLIESERDAGGFLESILAQGEIIYQA